MNAMAVTFPTGEKFFIDAVKLYKDRITDTQLLDEVKEFTKQEVWHSYAHQQYNDWMQAQNLPVERIIKDNDKIFEFNTYISKYIIDNVQDKLVESQILSGLK
jgi:predicted metal-dependent hydrolase